MLGFLKKILGLPTKEEIETAKVKTETVPYKVEAPAINNKTGDLVEAVAVAEVNPQITDAVTQAAPAKKTRKPRTPKTEKVVKEKAAKPVKAAAKKAVVKRSKKA